MLRNSRAQTHAFLKLMAPLGERLGPFMLQLGPRFGAAHLEQLRAYLRDCPTQFHYAVEVRHPDYFDQGADQAALHEVLREHRVNRCLFDTRCVHAGAAIDPTTAQAQERKPVLPLRMQAVGMRPLVRFVGQNRAEAAADYLDVWIEKLLEWCRAGLSRISSPTPRTTWRHPIWRGAYISVCVDCCHRCRPWRTSRRARGGSASAARGAVASLF